MPCPVSHGPVSPCPVSHSRMSSCTQHPSETASTSRFRTVLAMAAFVLLLAVSGCQRATPTPDVVPTPTTDAAERPADVIVQPRAQAPAPRRPRLAQMAVFPQTDAPLRVVTTQPSEGATGVSIGGEDASIVVRFNHPVVPLTELDAQENLPAAASIEPSVPGKGEWLDTSTWRFSPDDRLDPARRYRVEIDPELTDLLGATLESAYAFSFETAGPRILQRMPRQGQRLVAANRAITATFNHPMDLDSVRSAFSLLDEAGTSVDGAMSLTDDGTTMVFEPEAPLERDAEYRVRIAAAAQTAVGGVSLPEAREWTFQVAPPPGVASTQPSDGRENARLGWEGFVVRFTTPMAADAVTVTLQPTITNQSAWWDDERTLRVTGDWKASTTYTATVSGASATAEGEAIGEDVIVTFTLAPIEPMHNLNLAGDFGVYSAYETPRLWVSAVNRENVPVRLSRVPRGDLLELATNRSVYEYEPKADQVLREWTVDTSAPVDAWRTISTTLTADGRAIDPGAYFVSSDQGDRRERSVLLVSRINLTVKSTTEEVLVWATDIRSGEPVADVPISVYELGDVLLAEGTTDADGLMRADIERSSEPWEELAAVVERDGVVEAAVGRRWNGGIGVWEFRLPFTSWKVDFAATLYTDRPIYRPGQTVHYRGILRRDRDGDYGLPDVEGLDTVVRVMDANYEELARRRVTPNEFGAFHGDIAIAEAAPLGDYQIELAVAPRGDGPAAAEEQDDGPASPSDETVDVGADDDVDDGETSSGEPQPSWPEGPAVYNSVSTFRVAAYRAPAFEVAVEADRTDYMEGDTIDVGVEASYFFGAPVEDAPVRWRLMTEPFSFQPDVDGWWDWIDYDLRTDPAQSSGAEVVTEGETTTDADGAATFEVAADLPDDQPSRVFTMEADVTDVDNQVVSARTTAVVHQADLYIGLRPGEYVAETGEQATVELLALDIDERPVAGQEVQLQFNQRQWYSVREKREDGQFYWTSNYTDTVVAEQTVTTDDEGRAVATWIPEDGGTHRIVATAADAEGRTARSATYQWVVQRGGPFVNWRQENNDRIELVADEKSYAPGDVARILVPSPFARSVALQTIERGSIRSAEVVSLPTNSEIIEVPITEDMAPNAFVSVVLMHGAAHGAEGSTAEFKVGYVNLTVSTAGKQLDLEITPDRTEYGPRETAQWRIRTRDADGQPAAAELSVSLVDKAVLSLADRTTPALIDAFYGQRSLAVETGASLTRSLDRIDQQMEDAGKGGGGGMQAGPAVRSEFQDTAYWNAEVRTGDDGEAVVETTLPDNLTTWQLDARGVTGAETLVGEATEEIVSTKPVLVRPVLPRFVVADDNALLEAVVHNRTEEGVTLDVSITAIGLQVHDVLTHTVELPAGGRAEVGWLTTVDTDDLLPPTREDALGEVTVLVSAEGSGYQDAVEIDLPAYAFAAPETVATGGVVEDRITERFQVPAVSAARQPQLTVELNPSLAASNLRSLDALRQFPYDCVEQTVSKFLPNVITLRALGALGREHSELRDVLADEIPVALQKLYAAQQASGAWGWWSGSQDGNAWLTAYALWGMTVADQEGFEVSDDVMGRAQDYLAGWLDRQPVTADDELGTHAFVAWVLSERDALAASRAVTLWEQRAGLAVEGRSFLAMALAASGPEQSDRVAGMIADLSDDATVSATGARWSDDEANRAVMGTDTRSTAVALLAMARVDPDNALVERSVRWLLSVRRGDEWHTTQETAWAVLAMAEVITATGELDAAFDFQVELDGEPLGGGEVQAASAAEPTVLTATSDRLAAGADNDLLIAKSGTGRLYYSAHLRYFPDAETAEPVDGGIVVGRQYVPVDPTTFEPTGGPVDEIALGEVVQVQLTIITDERRHYVKIEDPLPAGLEGLDTSLKTTSAAASGPAVEEVPTDGATVPWWERSWWNYWTRAEVRDDRVVLFSDELDPGTYRYTYLARASLAGDFNVRPTQAEEMYFPEIFGRSAGGVFVVNP